uniref:BRCT domain-containing protein n=1 Tax=Ornithorhynchus anatinus TaxID=9258 RepID=F7AR20_ORNAN
MRIGPDSHLPARKVQGKNEKSKPFLKMMKNDANKQEKLKYKPLWGKVFYLDLPSILTAEKLEMDLKELGGRVEEFLSRDISYLISSKKEAKFAQMFGRISPVPSPESAYTGGNSSPDPSYDGNSVKTLDAVCVSRGKLLVEKAIKEQDFITPNSILSNALSWGVKILHLDDIKCYIEQKKKELCLIKKSSSSVREEDRLLGNRKTKRRLKKPFVKVEDVKRHYRPFYLQLADTPLLNYSTSKPCSPFDADKTTCVQKPTQAKLRFVKGVLPQQKLLVLSSVLYLLLSSCPLPVLIFCLPSSLLCSVLLICLSPSTYSFFCSHLFSPFDFFSPFQLSFPLLNYASPFLCLFASFPSQWIFLPGCHRHLGLFHLLFLSLPRSVFVLPPPPPPPRPNTHTHTRSQLCLALCHFLSFPLWVIPFHLHK